MKKAIIIGCLGQDGTLLYDYLLKKDYQIIGIDFNYIKTTYDYSGERINITDKSCVEEIIKSFNPDEVYHLAAVHHSSEDCIQEANIELFNKSFEINVFSLIYFLEAIYKFSKKTRLFYAASSHIFGETDSFLNDESTPINPNSIYGISKATGLNICSFYRKEFSLFSSCGIMYNHESSLRSDKFISKKIVKSAILAQKSRVSTVAFGDLNAEVDWGYAPDYVDAMHKLLNIDYPENFIIATGEKHKVSEFIDIAFSYLGLDYKNYVREHKDVLKRKPVCRIGNPAKLMAATGWKPSLSFKEMIYRLLKEEGAFEE